MFDKLEDILVRLEEILRDLSEPGVANDQKRFTQLMKEQAELTPIAEAYRAYKQAQQDEQDSLAMLEEENDEEMREMLKEELNDAKKRIEQMEQELKILLLPKDPNDDKNVIVEIRAGAGGDEAALFAAELYRMYVHYAEANRWKVETISFSEIGIGGMKEVVFMVTGQGAYSKLKYESGVHRVQRVPETESQGRIHTSAATVAVLPEAEDVEVEIDAKDLQIDTYRSGGAGGQHVNKTESAIRITHLPTGLVVQCQDERSQHKNKDKAMRVLKSRLLELYQSQKESAEASARKSMVGSGDRSERIRTYNFPQGRVTDHRINMTLYRLESFLDGDMDEMIDGLILAERTAQLSGEAE